jgi:hypothetical protein
MADDILPKGVMEQVTGTLADAQARQRAKSFAIKTKLVEFEFASWAETKDERAVQVVARGIDKKLVLDELMDSIKEVEKR